MFAGLPSSQRQSAIAKARRRRTLGSYTYGLLLAEFLEQRVMLAGAPTQIVFSVQPSSVAAGSPMFPSIQVSVLDSTGALVTTSTARITLSVGSPVGASMSGTTTVSAVG